MERSLGRPKKARRKVRARLAGLAAAVVLAACGGGGYSEDFRASFLTACEATSGGQVSYCECALDRLEDLQPDESEVTSGDMANAAMACAP